MVLYKISLIVLFLTGFTMAAWGSSLGQAQISECKANHNPFYEDQCKVVGSVRCAVEVKSNGLKNASIMVTLGNSKPLAAVIANPFEMLGTKNGSIAKSSLNFGGLDRGSVQTLIKNNKISSVQAVDVYINKNRTGLEYTRYRCGKFVN